MNQTIPKKPPHKQSNTIDEKHTEMLNQFYENETEIIPKLLEEKTQLKSMISNLKEHEIDAYMDIRDKIHNINSQVKELKQQKKRYLLDNSKYIFNYFEEKKKISSGDNNKNVKVLNSFFKIKANNDTISNLNSDKYSHSKKLYQNYWRNVNNEIINLQDFVIQSDVCENCRKGELIPQDEEGILICNNNDCGKFITYIIDSSKPTNKEPPNEVSYTAYIRLNHFKEILSQ
jgi:hypothetical protein